MKTISLAIALTALAAQAMAAPKPSARAVVEAKFAAVNRHAVDEIAAFYAPDARVNATDFCKPRAGRAEVARTYRELFAKIPDLRVEVQDYLSQGDRVAVRFTVSSHLPNATFSAPIMDFFTVRDGLITEDDGMFDNHGRPCTP